MARLDSKVLFMITSPRSPEKMIPEIDLLARNFSGMPWNKENQEGFMEVLRDEDFFHGQGAKDPAFSARDRINRAPKALGFVTLSPTIKLTRAGEELIDARYTNEIFLRQLLKFQIPSPYHQPTDKAAEFWVKPYLEIFRLIYTLGELKFDELMIFGMQLVDYRDFDKIIQKILAFREAKKTHRGSYKVFRGEYLARELRSIYADEISSGDTKTREQKGKSVDVFIKVKSGNMRDYADACFRYLRATGMINVSYVGKTLTIMKEKLEEVKFFLDHTDRNPCFVNNESRYVGYLTNPALPELMTDNPSLLYEKIQAEFPDVYVTRQTPVKEMKEILIEETARRKEKLIRAQQTELKDYKLYEEIQTTFNQIDRDKLYDIPLMLEWNVWRSMTMLDGGEIKANLKFDDFGKPMSTAQGNVADIVCNYGDFDVIVEVTMASGQRQYEMEGEPVSRHLGKLKKQTGKPTYCLFVAPTINEACIAHFYMLHQTSISYYGGKSIIIPVTLDNFKKMVNQAYAAPTKPRPSDIERFFKYSARVVKENVMASMDAPADNGATREEMLWYERMADRAQHWLV